MTTHALDRPQRLPDIPLPIVTLNRATLVVGIVAGLLLQQPLFTTALFLILLPAVLFGQRASLIFFVGRRLLARWNATAEREDRRMQRFNNTIAVVLLGAAQIAFLLGATVVGWALALLIVAAAVLAFVWAARSGQFDDTETPASRVLVDDAASREAAPAAARDARAADQAASLASAGSSRYLPARTPSSRLTR